MSTEDPGEGPSGTNGGDLFSLETFKWEDWINDCDADAPEILIRTKNAPEIEFIFDDIPPSSSGNAAPNDIPPLSPASAVLNDLPPLRFGNDGPDGFSFIMLDGPEGDAFREARAEQKKTNQEMYEMLCAEDPDLEMIPAGRLRDAEQELADTKRLLQEEKDLRKRVERRAARALDLAKIPKENDTYDYILHAPTTPTASENDLPVTADSLPRTSGIVAAGGKTGPPNEKATSTNRDDAVSPGFYEMPPPPRPVTPRRRSEKATTNRAQPSSYENLVPTPPSTDKRSHQPFNAPQHFPFSNAGLTAYGAPSNPSVPQQQTQNSGSSTSRVVDASTHRAKSYGAKAPRSLPQIPSSGISAAQRRPSDGNSSNSRKRRAISESSSDSHHSDDADGSDYEDTHRKRARKEAPNKFLDADAHEKPRHRSFGGKTIPQYASSIENPLEPISKGKNPEDAEDGTESRKRARKEDSDKFPDGYSLGNPPHRSFGEKFPPQIQPSIENPHEPMSKRKVSEDAEHGTSSRKRSKKEDPDAIYDSETGKKLKKGQWRNSRLRVLSVILQEENGDGVTSTTLWGRVCHRYCERYPDDYRENPEKAEGAMKNAWNRYGRALCNYDERKRKINTSLATSSQANRKKQGKKRETPAAPKSDYTPDRDPTPADEHSPIQHYQHHELDPEPPRPPLLSLGPPMLPPPPRVDPAREGLVAQEKFLEEAEANGRLSSLYPILPSVEYDPFNYDPFNAPL